MRFLLDGVYILAAVAVSPILLYRVIWLFDLAALADHWLESSAP
jgi:hypothetical protein